MRWTRRIPNTLTYLRIAVIPALVACFYLPGDLSHRLCAGLFLLACITDWLDGIIARALKAESEVGRFLDPIADKLLVATALMLLVEANTDSHTRADIIPAIAILCREILVSGLREFLSGIRISVPVSRLAKWKTATQMAAIFLLLLGAGGPAWLHAEGLGRILLWLAATLTLATGYAYIKTGWKHLQAG
jgi:CDP-diacylglycerol--glycerol-3-phosphate 3-phosphatidyltransferase